jgi:hypothetical protein
MGTEGVACIQTSSYRTTAAAGTARPQARRCRPRGRRARPPPPIDLAQLGRRHRLEGEHHPGDARRIGEHARRTSPHASHAEASKPVRSGSPRLGRFDSCAAPLEKSLHIARTRQPPVTAQASPARREPDQSPTSVSVPNSCKRDAADSARELAMTAAVRKRAARTPQPAGPLATSTAIRVGPTMNTIS